MLHNPLSRVDLLSKQSRHACPVDAPASSGSRGWTRTSTSSLNRRAGYFDTTLEYKLAEGMGIAPTTVLKPRLVSNQGPRLCRSPSKRSRGLVA